MRRYDLTPLFDAMKMTPGAACRQLRVSGSVMQDYRTRGVSEKVADRLATKAGFATYTIWPEMLQHAIEDADAAAEDAENQARLRENARRRKRYANDAAWREKKKAEAREYKAAARRSISVGNARWRRENADRIAARNAAHYEANRDKILARQREYDRRRAAEKRAQNQEKRAA